MMTHTSRCATVIALLGLVLAGCASAAKIQEVAEQPIIEVPDGKIAKPVQFKKIVIKLKRGEDIGGRFRPESYVLPRAT